MASGSDKGVRRSQALALAPYIDSLAAASDRVLERGRVRALDGVSGFVDYGDQCVVTHDSPWSIKFLYHQLTGSTYRGLYGEGNTGTAVQQLLVGTGAAATTLRVFWRSDDNTTIADINYATTLAVGLWREVEVIFNGVDEIEVVVDGVSKGVTSVTPKVTTLNTVAYGALKRDATTVYAHGRYSTLMTTKNGNPVIIDHQNDKSSLLSVNTVSGGSDGVLMGGATSVVDNDLPADKDALNNLGYNRGRLFSAANGRLRWETGVITPFEMSRVKVCFYQPEDVTNATSGKGFFTLNSGNSNNDMAVKMGSSTGLLTGEVVTFFPAGSARVASTDTLPAGYHELEIIHAGGTSWEIWIDGVEMDQITYTSRIERTVDMVWTNVTPGGQDGVAGRVFYSLQIWNDSDELAFDADFRGETVVDRISGKEPTAESFNEHILVGLDSSDSSVDAYGAPAEFVGPALPVPPQLRDSYAGDFDGSTVYAESAVEAGLASSVGDAKTFCAFFEQHAQITGDAGIVGLGWDGTGSGNEWYCIGVNRDSRKLFFFRRFNGAYSSVDSGIEIEYNQEYHVAVVLESTSLVKFYVNGILVKTATPTAQSVPTTTNKFLVGSLRESGSSYGRFDGSIYGAGYYKSALTDEQILSLSKGEVVSGGTAFVPFCDGKGDYARNVFNSNLPCEIQGASTGVKGSGFWGARQSKLHYSFRYGFSLNEVPDISVEGFAGFVVDTGITLESGDDELHFASVASGDYAYRTGITVSGKTYRICFEIYDYVEGGLRFRSGGGANYTSIVNGNGEYELDLVSDSTTVRAMTSGDSTYKVRGFKIKEVHSPAVNIPALADGSGNDALDDVLTNPAVAGSHNNAETTRHAYDIGVGGYPIPASSNHSDLTTIDFDEDVTSNDAAFMRLKSSNLNDRLLVYPDDLTGDDLDKLEQYTT